MADTCVVHCKRSRYDVYIGRPSQWGKPFTIRRDGDRAQVIARYERWLMQQPELVAALPELAGKTLGCWCAPQACHGDVLAPPAGGRHAQTRDPANDSRWRGHALCGERTLPRVLRKRGARTCVPVSIKGRPCTWLLASLRRGDLATALAEARESCTP